MHNPIFKQLLIQLTRRQIYFEPSLSEHFVCENLASGCVREADPGWRQQVGLHRRKLLQETQYHVVLDLFGFDGAELIVRGPISRYNCCTFVLHSRSTIIEHCVYARHCLRTPLSTHAIVYARHCLRTPLSTHAIVYARHCLRTPLSTHAISICTAGR